MVKVRPETILAGLSGKPGPMSKVGSRGMQIVGAGGMTWANKRAFLRNLPYTIENPHLGQIEQRLAFAEAASSARGKEGLDPATGYPQAAAAVQAQLSRRHPARHRIKSKEEYPSRIHPSFHNKNELEALRQMKLKESRKKSRTVVPPMIE